MTQSSDDTSPPTDHATSRATSPASRADSLAEILVRAPRREVSGARITNRIGYQKYWALGEIVRRHQSGENYCVLFEVHDDVVILDDPKAPTKIWLYQVKTRTPSLGNWTEKRLVAIEKEEVDELVLSSDDRAGGGGNTKGKLAPKVQATTESSSRGNDDHKAPKLSILAKLFHHTTIFGDKIALLGFVTNARFSVALKEGKSQDLDEIPLDALADDACETLLGDLRPHFGAHLTREHIRIFRFIHSPNWLSHPSKHAKALLQEYLEARYANRSLRSAAIFDMLLLDITRQTEQEQPPRSLDALLNEQGITRDQVERNIVRMAIHEDTEGDLARVIDAAGWPFGKAQRFKQGCRDYFRRRTSPRARELHAASAALRDIVGPVMQSHPHVSLMDIEAAAMATIKLSPPPEVAGWSDTELSTAIIVEATVYHAESEIAAADPSSSGEAV